MRRTRAEWLGHLQPTHRQDTRPDLGQQLADQAKRHGGAERVAEPAGPKRLAVDLALMGHDAARRRARARSIRTAAQPPDANTRALRRTGPGMGESLRRVRLDAIHDLQRFRRGHEVGSSGRRVTRAQASAGQRSGTAGTPSGQASRTWAVSAAAVFVLRHPPPGQTWLVRLENQQGQGTALTGLAPKRARAVSQR